MSKKALIILTSHGELGDTGNPTGFFWEELAAPYWALRDADIEIELASIKGGEPPADPGSDDGEDRPEAVNRFMNDQTAMRDLANTRPVSDVDPTAYDIVFLPGGHGTMWDFAQSEALGRLIARAYENKAVVGAVCHGPSGLLGARLSNGDPLVKGKRVNGFTNAEEEAVELTEVVPFALETRLREAGGDYACSKEPFQPFAVRDGRLITGQNPQSSERVAELMLEALDENGA